MIAAAEGGNINVRAAASTAYRVHIGRLVAGREDEMSEDAEAGEFLDARAAQHVHEIREALPEIVKALSAGG